MSHEITDGNQMLIPLYHGTSRMFLASMKRHGLGAKDPNSQVRSYELLSELLEIMEKQDWFYDEKSYCTKMDIADHGEPASN